MNVIALTIAGSDSGGGAGIQADLKTFSALGVYGASVITALTAQNTLGVEGVFDIPPDFVKAQCLSVLLDLEVRAIKIGMLSQIDTIRSIVGVLSDFPHIPVVLDPVMVATSGDPLISDDAVDVLKSELIPLASVITPNLYEAARLLKTSPARSKDEMLTQAKALFEAGNGGAVLIKGGHGTTQRCCDVLVRASAPPHWFESARIKTQNTHGTGCTLSSAIAAELAKNAQLETAVQTAKTYTSAAIMAGKNLKIGKGRGPVDHFHELWKAL